MPLVAAWIIANAVLIGIGVAVVSGGASVYSANKTRQQTNAPAEERAAAEKAAFEKLKSLLDPIVQTASFPMPGEVQPAAGQL